MAKLIITACMLLTALIAYLILRHKRANRFEDPEEEQKTEERAALYRQKLMEEKNLEEYCGTNPYIYSEEDKETEE